MSSAQEHPVVVVTGPTASGKSGVALDVCRRLNGELINADAFQIYRGMDIGTAKTPEHERDGIPHHLIDIRNPDEPYTVADYVQDASACIADVLRRGRCPVVCGGTGLYVQSLIEGLSFHEDAADPVVRKQLEDLEKTEGVPALLHQLETLDPEAAARLHPNNRRRIIRSLEATLVSGKTQKQRHAESRAVASPFTFQSTCITRERKALYAAIDARVDAMVRDGLLEEVRALFSSGTGQTARQAIGYKEFIPYLDGTENLAVCVSEVKKATRRYAKRQETWFRRMPYLDFMDNRDPEETACRIADRWSSTASADS